MSHTYKQGFFSDEQVSTLFRNASESMRLIHEEQGPYAHIAEFLRTELGMRDPLCVQTFAIGLEYDPQWAHIDVATAIYPSITNLWFCEQSCPGDSFGFLEYENHQQEYRDFFAGIQRGSLVDYDSLCSEELFDKYTKITDYQKGDALFFDSRQVHRKLSSTPRRTLVFKYINSEDLEDRTPINYAEIPGGPDWVRVLVFDRLRHIEGHEARKKFIRDTERLISSKARPLVEPRGAAQESAPSLLQRLMRKLSR